MNKTLGLLVGMWLLLVSASPAMAQYYYRPGFGSNTGQSFMPNPQNGANTGNSIIPNPQAGAATGSAPVNPYYMQNQSGLGFYGARPLYGYGYGYGAYGAPVPINGGLFSIRAGNSAFNFWKAPSGYYYPWYQGAYMYNPPIILYQQGSTQGTPSQPPLSTMFNDMRSFINQSKDSGKLSDDDYHHLYQRLQDIQSKESSQRIAGGGVLDEQSENQTRGDLDQLSSELTHRLKP